MSVPSPGRRGLALAGLHLAVLWSLAAVQPLLNVLGDAPEFFVARENTRGDILLLAFGLVLVPPLAFVAVEALVDQISRRAGRVVHLGFVALLAAAFALQVLEDVVGGGRAAVLLLLAAV